MKSKSQGYSSMVNWILSGILDLGGGLGRRLRSAHSPWIGTWGKCCCNSHVSIGMRALLEEPSESKVYLSWAISIHGA
jgi:hypothetical protein